MPAQCRTPPDRAAAHALIWAELAAKSAASVAEGANRKRSNRSEALISHLNMEALQGTIMVKPIN
ncbi:hypothetical protein XI07_04795 [Bradyrhizobium sp. CCBAU 11445]|nr:hypothetical protein [Bradyrhizobium sp. CCBAU 11445]